MMKAASAISQKAILASPPEAIRKAIITAMKTPSAILIAWRIGRRMGAPDILPLSFAKAITDPEKVMAPIAVPSESSNRESLCKCPLASAMPKASGANRAAAATSTAAMPTRE